MASQTIGKLQSHRLTRRPGRLQTSFRATIGPPRSARGSPKQTEKTRSSTEGREATRERSITKPFLNKNCQILLENVWSNYASTLPTLAKSWTPVHWQTAISTAQDYLYEILTISTAQDYLSEKEVTSTSLVKESVDKF